MRSPSKKVRQKEQKKFPSELRFDLISKDWVVIATGRGKRPEMFKGEKRVEIKVPKKDCRFCNIEPQLIPVLIYNRGKKMPLEGKVPRKWTTVVIPNKFPALLPCTKMEKRREGKFYQTINGCGYCELVVTRDHQKHFPHFKVSEVKEVFDAYQQRCLSLMKKPLVNYISIFYNHGKEAGASQPHPHSQIITTPLVDIGLRNAILNAKSYYEKHKKCIYCEMNNWERRVRKRIVFENKDFLVVCPFASKSAFEVIVSPKRHLSYFEKISDKEKWQLAEAFQKAMIALYKGLGDPPYNFYLHTAPCNRKDCFQYHWHWTILPKTSTPAGFEIGTQMEISTIEPEKAAEYLRKQLR